MIKKVLVLGVFLGGGYYFIKKVLPKLTKNTYDLDTLSIDERVALEERKRAEFEKKMRDNFERKLGTRNPENYSASELTKKMMFAPNFQYDENGKLMLNGSKLDFGIKYDPNNLNSFRGYGNVNLTSMFG